MKQARSFTYGLALGAGLSYFLDPRQSGARRARIRDKSVRAVHELEHAASIGSRDLEHRAKGLVARARGGREDVSDEVLVERVRTTLGHHCSHPHAIAVKAKGEGVIELKGPVLASDVDEVRRAAARVRGVRGIDDDLEIHERAGDVPGLQGPPMRRSRIRRATPATKLVAGIALGGLALSSLAAGRPLGMLFGSAGVLALARSINARGNRILPAPGAQLAEKTAPRRDEILPMPM